jgi:hypothetical protein
MSVHGEDEAASSSPLSSPSSSIFNLDEFDSTPLKRAPGPALTDNLPSFNPDLVPVTESESKSRSSSTMSLPDVLRDKTMPGSDPDDDLVAETIIAHYDISCGYEQEPPAEIPTASGAQEAPADDTCQDVPAADACCRQATPPMAEKRAATTESPDPIAAVSVEETPKNGRKRKAPEATSNTKRKVVVKKARKNDSKKWQAPSVFTDAKSPLVNAPLRVWLHPTSTTGDYTLNLPQAILLHPQAWDVLSADDQAELGAMLALDHPASLSHSPSPSASGPQDGKSLPARGRPNLDYLRSDDSFRFDCARYTENIEAGCHDEAWLVEAWTAHERRKRGDFKQYLARKLERDWDVVLPVADESDEAVEKSRPLEENGVKDSGADQLESAAALGDSPVTSSVGETRFTDLKLNTVPKAEMERTVESFNGDGTVEEDNVTGVVA